MKPSQPISLNSKDHYDLGGKVMTLSELQDAVIKASMYDKLKSDIKGGK